MRISLIAVTLTLLAGTLPAFSQTFEDTLARSQAEIREAEAVRRAARAEAARAEAAAEAARAASETNPCTENTQLDKAAFTVGLNDGSALAMSFKSCKPYYVDEAPHGRLEASQAIRSYEDGKTKYVLVIVTTKGSDKSEVILIREVSYVARTVVATSSLSEVVTIDLSGKAKVSPQVTSTPPAYDDEPNGRDCR